MNNNKAIWLFILAVIILPFAAYSVFTLYENKFQRLPIYGESKTIKSKKVDHHIADFAFKNQNNEIVKAASWSNKIVVANFFFTHCPSICPKMTNNLKKVQEAFSKDPGIIISSFSVNPEADSAARLKKYVSQFNINTDNWELLTGDKKEIYKLARNSFLVVATNGDGGPTDFIHSDKLILIDKQKRIRGYYDGTGEKEVNKLIHDIKKLKNEN